MAFIVPVVGAWTIPVAEGNASISEGEAAETDLVMTQSAETFDKSLRRIHNPVTLLIGIQLLINLVA